MCCKAFDKLFSFDFFPPPFKTVRSLVACKPHKNKQLGQIWFMGCSVPTPYSNCYLFLVSCTSFLLLGSGPVLGYFPLPVHGSLHPWGSGPAAEAPLSRNLVRSKRHNGPMDQQWPGWQWPLPNVAAISTVYQYTVASLAHKVLHSPPPDPQSYSYTWLVFSSKYKKKKKNDVHHFSVNTGRVSVQFLILPHSCYSDYWPFRWWCLNQPGPWCRDLQWWVIDR